jgi:hypothetical protein
VRQAPTATVRDEIVGYGATINGLPILEGEEANTLKQWYRENVIGGQGSFLMPAQGFGDFGRAIRQKFVVEVSSRDCASACQRQSVAGHNYDRLR